jgi:hypothetical protein
MNTKNWWEGNILPNRFINNQRFLVQKKGGQFGFPFFCTIFDAYFLNFRTLKWFVMKRILIVFLCLMTVLSVVSAQNGRSGRRSQRLERRREIAIKVDSLVTSRTFTFRAREAIPASMPVMHLTSEYDLKVSGDSIFVFLPYYGRAYTADYMSREGGIKVKGVVEDYYLAIESDQYRIDFDVKTESDTYQFRLSVWKSGYASLYVNCYNRQFIPFSGILGGIGL